MGVQRRHRLRRNGRSRPGLRAEITRSDDRRRTSEIAVTRRFRFRLRGATGTVTVSFQANEDPQRWGYGTLRLTWPSELAKGLPVLNAHTECSLEGYATMMGWIQVVRITSSSPVSL
jgi:hypothetical protein